MRDGAAKGRRAIESAIDSGDRPPLAASFTLKGVLVVLTRVDDQYRVF